MGGERGSVGLELLVLIVCDCVDDAYDATLEAGVALSMFSICCICPAAGVGAGGAAGD